MTTNDLFKKIYNELKFELSKNSTDRFLKEYEIPSINFNPTDTTLSDHYFTSGIEMEIERILELLDYKIHYYSYQDKYFFSNDKELAKEKMLSVVKVKENYENNIEL